MLTEERHNIILEVLKKEGIVKLNELVKLTDTSESTIRRDLTFLENKKALKRVHGGATLLKGSQEEPSYNEKLIQKISEKSKIAKYAAELIEDGDCVYLDGGTTTFEMIKYIDKKNIIVVTNGIKHIDELLENNITGYIIGGKVKATTKVVVGSDALINFKKFRFDKAFLGINGIHLEFGFTTPDLEEASLKQAAIELSKEAFVLADESKFGEITFVKVGDLEEATIITDVQVENYDKYNEKTKIKVVK